MPTTLSTFPKASEAEVSVPGIAACGRAGPASERWPALDGLRGLMTVGVFVAHIKYSWLPGSILFMDLFFMMSSFFITRLLLREWQRKGSIDFRSFYVRRLKRLYPAMLAVVLAIASFTALYPGAGGGRWLGVAGTLLYFQNWLLAFRLPNQSYLGHTWSLSIEGQFYLVWPVLFLAALLVGARRRGEAGEARPNLAVAAVLLGGVALAAMLWRAWLASRGTHWLRLYAGTDMRLDSLALGALLAFVLDTRHLQRAASLLAKPGLVWLMVAALLFGAFNVHMMSPAWYAWQQPLYVLVSLGVIMAFLKTPTGWGLGFVFQNPVSLYLGAICYGLYLWHFPLIWFCRSVLHAEAWLAILVCAPLSLALASLSYFYLELPALNGRRDSAR